MKKYKILALSKLAEERLENDILEYLSDFINSEVYESSNYCHLDNDSFLVLEDDELIHRKFLILEDIILNK